MYLFYFIIFYYSGVVFFCEISMIQLYFYRQAWGKCIIINMNISFSRMMLKQFRIEVR